MPRTTSQISIGILRTSSIGDVVLATSCINLLRILKIQARIYWIGNEPSLSIISKSFPQISCIKIKEPLNSKILVKSLYEIDFILDLQLNLRSRIVSQIYKARYKRPVFSSSKLQLRKSRLVLESRIYGRNRSLSKNFQKNTRPQYVLMAQSLLSALQSLKIVNQLASVNVNSAIPYIPQTPATDLKSLSSIKWIATAPSSFYETKRAPLSVFIKILEEVSKKSLKENRGPVGLFILGGPDDTVLCSELQSKIKWSVGPVKNFSGNLSLTENADLLARTYYLLSNDSSLSHIAEAVNTPVGVLFGPTIEAFGFAPHLEESRAFSSQLGCRPCSKHGKSPCRFKDMKCFLEINTDEVAKHLCKALKKEKLKREECT